jgi:hypothetical protein
MGYIIMLDIRKINIIWGFDNVKWISYIFDILINKKKVIMAKRIGFIALGCVLWFFGFGITFDGANHGEISEVIFGTSLLLGGTYISLVNAIIVGIRMAHSEINENGKQ